MIRNSLNFVARQLKGTDYVIDPAVTSMALICLAWRRACQLLRGIIFFQRFVFLGKRVQLVNRKYLRIGKSLTIQDGVYIDALSKDGVTLGDNCNIGPMTVIQASGVLTCLVVGLSVGSNSGIGGFSFIGCGGGVSIGSDVIMGQYVSFHSENHIFDNVEKPIRIQGVTRDGIVIGDDCWIGAKTTFLDGSRVGSGCVIAAGSVVRGVIPPFSVVAGVPARVIRSRFTIGPVSAPTKVTKCV